MSKKTARPACTVKPRTPRIIPPGMTDERMRLLRLLATKWVNGTVLHYWFFNGPAPQLQAVRDAFTEWKALKIGLEFVEVQNSSEAEVRIGFDQADGSWSYIGRDILGIAATQPTMNFGWDLTDAYGHTTALHEIGHTLGMPMSTRARSRASSGTNRRSTTTSPANPTTGPASRPSRMS